MFYQYPLVLARLFLMHSSMLLGVFATKAHSWITVRSLFTRIPRSFSNSYLPGGYPPVCFGAQRFSSQVWDFTYPSLYFVRLPSVNFSSLLASTKRQHNHVVCINHSSSFSPRVSLWRVHSPQSPMSLMKMLNSFSQVLTAEDPH